MSIDEKTAERDTVMAEVQTLKALVEQAKVSDPNLPAAALILNILQSGFTASNDRAAQALKETEVMTSQISDMQAAIEKDESAIQVSFQNNWWYLLLSHEMDRMRGAEQGIWTRSWNVCGYDILR